MSTKQDDSKSSNSLNNLNETKLKTIKSSKPSLQIYKPPGLRGVSYQQLNKTSFHETDHTLDINSDTNLNSEDCKINSCIKKPSKSVSSQKDTINSVEDSSTSKNQSIIRTKSKVVLKPHVLKEAKKKQFSKKDEEDIIVIFKSLNIAKEKLLIDDIIAGLNNEDIASNLAQILIHFAIEERKQSGRAVARLCALLLACPTGKVFHEGFITVINQYYENRNQLRATQLKVWINFLGFISDLYSSVGFTYEGGLVDIIFEAFNFMLNPPVLETLKIEELECIIASLLSVGYDLERNCPDQLSCLKNTFRNAFIKANEPWARKMILLLIELSASDWTLTDDANKYYFQ